MDKPLYYGQKITFCAHDPDQDAEIESRWTCDLDLMHAITTKPPRLLSPEQIKKSYEDVRKEKDNTRFSFALRTTDGNRLVGFARIHHVDWNHSNAWIRFAIAEPQERGKGFGTEALQLLLRYAFHELNLRRVSASTLNSNTISIHLLEKAGFLFEVRQREMVYMNGCYQDQLVFGLLVEEWQRGRL